MLLQHHRSFLAVAKHQGLREASTELHLTQSAISKRLQSLQEELGVKLYRRSAQGIELTEAGRTALTKVEFILKQVDGLQQIFRVTTRPKQEPVVFTIAGAFSL